VGLALTWGSFLDFSAAVAVMTKFLPTLRVPELLLERLLRAY
jgi:hypothetical protein